MADEIATLITQLDFLCKIGRGPMCVHCHPDELFLQFGMNSGYLIQNRILSRLPCAASVGLCDPSDGGGCFHELMAVR